MKKLVSIIFLGAILIACGPEKPKEKSDGVLRQDTWKI